MMNERRMRADAQMQASMGGMRNGMMPNGMAMSGDMAKRMMMQNHQQQQQQQQQGGQRVTNP